MNPPDNLHAPREAQSQRKQLDPNAGVFRLVIWARFYAGGWHFGVGRRGVSGLTDGLGSAMQSAVACEGSLACGLNWEAQGFEWPMVALSVF